MMRKLMLAAAAGAVSLLAFAEIPSGYYKPLNGISEPAELKTAVFTVINPHTVPQVGGYDSYYYQGLPVYFRQTDTYPESDKWWDMYANIDLYAPSMAGLNREHSFPKSWWGGSTTIPPFVDLNHLYPAERTANMAKSNYPLGCVDMGETVKFDNGVSKVGYPVAGQGGNSKNVFEPADEYKGDFARTYFYMVTCYQNLTWNPSYSWMLQSNAYPTLAPWAQTLLLEWSRNDPVSQKEIDRNEAVYRIQNNRNPFIDLPGLEEYIWGNKKNQEFKVDTGGSNPSGTPVLFSPVENMSVDFDQVAAGGSTRRLLLFSGENLKGNVSVTVTGPDRKLFAIEQRTIAASSINASGGFYLAIDYRPTAVGSHTANLTVYDVDGWDAGRSLNVALRGEALARPSLSKIKALPPSDVTATSYVANWEVPAGEVVDYYILTRTHRLPDGHQTAVVTYQCEENSQLIEDFSNDLFDYYTVQSVRLGYRSPMSDAIHVGNGGFQTVGQTDAQPLQAIVYGSTVRFLCGETITGARLYDIAGRLLRELPPIERNTEMEFRPGVYIITVDGSTAPLKILIR